MSPKGTWQPEVWPWKRDWYGLVVESMGFQVSQTWVPVPSLPLCGLLSSYTLGILIIPQRAPLRINEVIHVRQVRSLTECLNRPNAQWLVFCDLWSRWWISSLEGTLEIICPLLPLTAEHKTPRQLSLATEPVEDSSFCQKVGLQTPNPAWLLPQLQALGSSILFWWWLWVVTHSLWLHSHTSNKYLLSRCNDKNTQILYSVILLCHRGNKICISN